MDRSFDWWGIFCRLGEFFGEWFWREWGHLEWKIKHIS